MTDEDPTGRWWLHTAWRAGSRRAVVECLSICLSVRDALARPDPEPSAGPGSDEYDPTWYAEQAVAMGYITADQADILLSDDAPARNRVLRTIWDFETDPAAAQDRALHAQRSALRERLLTDEKKSVLRGGDRQAAEPIWRSLLQDPEYAALSWHMPPDWSLDWPEGTPVDRVGPRRRLRPGRDSR